MATSPADRWRLLKLKRRILTQLRELETLRSELDEINADESMCPTAADDHPWILSIDPMRRELVGYLADIEAGLTYPAI